MTNTFFDKAFRDDDGAIVIAQPPNLPIIIWAGASMLKLIAPSDQVRSGLDFLAFGALFTWAWLELFEGVNYFRRTLGLVVLISLLGSKVFTPQR
jgi:hypothetical protein